MRAASPGRRRSYDGLLCCGTRRRIHNGQNRLHACRAMRAEPAAFAVALEARDVVTQLLRLGGADASSGRAAPSSSGATTAVWLGAEAHGSGTRRSTALGDRLAVARAFLGQLGAARALHLRGLRAAHCGRSGEATSASGPATHAVSGRSHPGAFATAGTAGRRPDGSHAERPPCGRARCS